MPLCEFQTSTHPECASSRTHLRVNMSLSAFARHEGHHLCRQSSGNEQACHLACMLCASQHHSMSCVFHIPKCKNCLLDHTRHGTSSESTACLSWLCPEGDSNCKAPLPAVATSNKLLWMPACQSVRRTHFGPQNDSLLLPLADFSHDFEQQGCDP